MTSNEKFEQEMRPLSLESKDSAEPIKADSKAVVDEMTSFPHFHQSRELDQHSSKNDEESEVMNDGSDASHTENAIPIDQSASLPLSVHPAALRLQPDNEKRQIRVGRLVMSIIISIVVLLLAMGMVGIWIIPRTPTKLAIGTLLYLYHTSNKAAIYPTYVNGLAWSPNGQYLACAAGDEAVHVLMPDAQKEVFVYHGHHGYVNNVAWFPGGERIASVSADQTVQIWDATTGNNVVTFIGSSSLWTVAVSPDGNLIAFAGKNGLVEVWQVSPKMYIYTYTGQVHAGGIWGLGFSPDGKRIASGDSAGVIQVWDATNGGNVLTYKGHTKQIYDLKWSPDGQYIASASEDGTVQVWNASNGGTVYIHRFSSTPMQAVAWSPDGTRIASASANGTVQVWDALDGGHLFVYHHHSGAVYTVEWSPDGSRIASGDESGSVQVWQAV